MEKASESTGAASPGNERSRSLFERAAKVMPRGNSRHSVYFTPHPLYCVSGSGCRVVDADGQERIDFVNNYSSLIHGHGHPAVLAALHRQADRLVAVGMPTEVEVELAELLCARIDSVEQVRFTNSGTEAVMMAVKAARGYTLRPKIAKFEGCYHGTYDPVEVSQAPRPESWGPSDSPASVALSRGTPHSMVCDTVILPWNDTAAVRRTLEQHRTELACILVDLAPAHLGYIEADGGVLAALREFCDSSGALLVCDEVYSLRVDFNGAQHRRKVRPDITVMGKIIGGGLPIGAVGGRRDVMAVFDPLPAGPAVVHGGTYNANPMSMAAGHASMLALTREQITRLELLGDYLRGELRLLARKHKVEVVVGGLASMISFSFGAGPLRNYRDRAALIDQRRKVELLHRLMLDRGILIASQGLAVLSTAMDRPEADAFLAAADGSFRKLG